MPQALYGMTLSIGGVSIQKTVLRSADSVIGGEYTLPVGKAVTDWVKTDANTAACNLPAGHAYTDGNFDVYWTEASVKKVRYGVPGVITTNALALDGGAGDDFPASATTGIVVTKQVQINASIDGDALEILGMSAEFNSTSEASQVHLDFQESDNTSVESVTLTANSPRIDDIEGGVANGFAGDPITKIMASNGSSANACTLKIAGLQDNTP